MSTLYITEQGSKLRKTHDRIIVEKDGENLLDVQYFKIDSVCIFGNVQFTTQAASELLEHGIEMALFTMDGKLKGQLTPVKPKNIVLRINQYEKSKDPEFCLKFSKIIVKAKIENCLDLIKDFSKNHTEVKLEEMCFLEKASENTDIAKNKKELLGIEGSAAKVYYNAFGKMLLGDFTFRKRTRRPPTDPVNSLLSFCYVLITNEIHSLLDGIGFDPYIGFYHEIEYSRPSLALDIIEIYRASLVDRFVLSLINKRVFHKNNFLKGDNGGIYLNREGKKKFFREYERMMNRSVDIQGDKVNYSYRELFRKEAYRIEKLLIDGKPYTPTRF